MMKQIIFFIQDLIRVRLWRQTPQDETDVIFICNCGVMHCHCHRSRCVHSWLHHSHHLYHQMHYRCHHRPVAQTMMIIKINLMMITMMMLARKLYKMPKATRLNFLAHNDQLHLTFLRSCRMNCRTLRINDSHSQKEAIAIIIIIITISNHYHSNKCSCNTFSGIWC